MGGQGGVFHAQLILHFGGCSFWLPPTESNSADVRENKVHESNICTNNNPLPLHRSETTLSSKIPSTKPTL